MFKNQQLRNSIAALRLEVIALQGRVTDLEVVVSFAIADGRKKTEPPIANLTPRR